MGYCCFRLHILGHMSVSMSVSFFPPSSSHLLMNLPQQNAVTTLPQWELLHQMPLNEYFLMYWFATLPWIPSLSFLEILYVPTSQWVLWLLLMSTARVKAEIVALKMLASIHPPIRSALALCHTLASHFPSFELVQTGQSVGIATLVFCIYIHLDSPLDLLP